jgi:hypothetical protein
MKKDKDGIETICKQREQECESNNGKEFKSITVHGIS